MEKLLSDINGFVWGVPALILILSVGVYIGVKTHFAQLRLFPEAVARFWRMLKGKEGDSAFRALCTALAATVGTGNIAGVAGAIALGGPGSIFWMWVCAFLGMGIKFAEAVLAVRYRKVGRSGELLAGPMYMMAEGMGPGFRWLGVCYCLLGCMAAFGMGSAVQINSVIRSVHQASQNLGCPLPGWTGPCLGIILGALAAWCLLGGGKRIGDLASGLIPVASAAYIALCLGAIGFHWDRIPEALEAVFLGAFQPKAVTGGVVGSVLLSVRVGASRGVFTNEAGMGTAAIAHGTAETDQPVRQGLMGIMEVFLDTFLICTLTALVILTAGISIPYGTDEGAALTTRAFAATYGNWVSVPMALFLSAFAFATVLGWGFYGLRCAAFLFGEGAAKPFALLLAFGGILGVLMETGPVWILSELFNGLMAIPNLIALAALCPETARLTLAYGKRSVRRRSAEIKRPEAAKEAAAPFPPGTGR